MDAITFRCPACKHAMKVGAEKAGRKAKCPKCKAELTIPQSESVTPAAAPAPEVEDEFKVGGSYQVVVDKDFEEQRKKREEEEEKQKKKKKKDKPTHRVEIKKKELKDKKRWLLVRRSLPVFMGAVVVWAASFFFSVLMVVIGIFTDNDYASTAHRALDELPPDPPPGFVQNMDPLSLCLGVIVGSDSVGLARTFAIIGQLLALLAGALFLTGYILAQPVPNRNGTAGQIKMLIILCCVNLGLVVIFRLLPFLGLFGGWLTLLTPEVAMTQANIDRTLPLHVFWSFSGFWSEWLTLIVLFSLYLEPILLGLFFWSVGQSMREAELESRGLGLASWGFGVYFIMLSFHIMSICGTSAVLTIVLRVVYLLWVGFTVLWMVRYFQILMLARDTFDRLIFGEEYADQAEKDEDEEEE